MAKLLVYCGPSLLIHKQHMYNCYHYASELRQPTQDAPEEVRARDFRRELEERERVAAREKTRERGPRGQFSVCITLLNCREYLKRPRLH